MDRDRSLDIAVTGVAGRFPGVSTIAEWWSALVAGTVLTTHLNRDLLVRAGVPDDLLDDPDYVPARGYLADADRFDNTLFRVSARDAELMDPQHRLMLEVAWAALEDAASPFGDHPVTGVYASDSGSGYLRSMLATSPLDPQTLDQAIHGTEPDFIASLISYKLDLTGPSIGVRTACSSSLVGLHLAITALLNGECDQALVVAAGIDFPQAGYLHVDGGINSRRGACRPFDTTADGVIAGSGVAAVVLRRLADAALVGPEAYGVILGTAVNNDGAAKVGYYAPSIEGQEAVIRAALNSADVAADSIGYLETHGTGTRIGDPIEWSAACAALSELGARPGQVAVGGLKANIGHLDSASGLASLIKALFVVKEGVVPPLAGFTELNPLLETEDSPLFIPAEAMPWAGPEPRRAGISSFGIGGTNVHVVIEQAQTHPVRSVTADTPRLVMVSAADAEALSRATSRLADHLTEADPPLTDVAVTLAGRAQLPERLVVTGRHAGEVAVRLTTGGGAVRGRLSDVGARPAVFLFPGQGCQYPGMAVPFLEALPGFDAALANCLASFEPAIATRLRRALVERDFPAAELAATELAQPALFAVEFAAATALSALGVAPAGLVGHSLGEIVAACVAGVFDLPTATRFVVARGRAMQNCPAGRMLALGCGEGAARSLLSESGLELEIAAINGAESCVVAGQADAVEKFHSWLGDRIFAKLLRTNRAFHTAQMEPVVAQLAREIADIDLRRPVVPLAVNATGQLVPSGGQVRPEIFLEQIRRPVLFADALAALARSLPDAVFIEVGPGRVLSGLAEAEDLTTVPLSPGRSEHPDEELLLAIGKLWTLGLPLSPTTLCGSGERIHLPTYPASGPRWLAPEVAGNPGHPAATAVAADAAVASVEAETVDVATLMTTWWAELLGAAQLGADSDFFQLGGDSMLITQLARKVYQELGIRVPLRDMLVGQTLGKQTTIVLDMLEKSAAPC